MSLFRRQGIEFDFPALARTNLRTFPRVTRRISVINVLIQLSGDWQCVAKFENTKLFRKIQTKGLVSCSKTD